MKLFEKILLVVARGALFASVFTPLVVDNSSIFPFIQPRTLLLEGLVTAGVVATALLLFFFKEYRRPLYKSRVVQAVALFIFVNLLTTLTSQDTAKSFLGTFERAYGFMQLAYFSALTLVAALVLNKNVLWKVLFGLIAFVSFASGLHYILAVHEHGSIYVKTITGNVTFLGGLTSIGIFCTLHLAHQVKNRYMRFALYGLTLFLIYATIATGLRAAFVGMALAGLFLLLRSLWSASSKTKTWLVVCGGTVILLYALLFTARDTKAIQRIDVLNRITHFKTETSNARLVLWGWPSKDLKTTRL